MNTLFNDEDQTVVPQIDLNKDYLKELVGEGKKFKTPEDLARGKYEADLYIDTLKKRQDELRADYLREREDNMAKANLQELLDQMRTQTQNSRSDITPVVREPDISKSMDPDEIDKIFSNKIAQHELSKKETENFSKVESKLKERYGRDYQSVLKEQMDYLGLSQEDINSLAKKSPTAFFKTLGLDEVKEDSFQAPPQSNRRSDPFKPTVQKRTWSWYQAMKKENPKLYHDPKTIVQMHNDAIALGADFEDGNFGKI